MASEKAAGRANSSLAKPLRKVIEQASASFRNLIEPILELRSSVHIIPTSVAADCLGNLAAISPVLKPRAAGARGPILPVLTD